MVLTSVAVIFLLLYAVLIIYYNKGWQSLQEFVPGKKSSLSKISVLIAARNEAANISNLLDSLAAQTYPKECFEIIVIDDFSTDNTAQIVASYNLENLRLVQPNTNDEQSSKKKAIESGVACAKGELIVTTDADCVAGKNWLQTINDFYVQTGASFIAAPVKFCYNSSLLQKFQTLDFLMLQGITAASVATSFHSMCNGANLVYTKEAFNNAGGFKGIDHVASGDDMLLMHKIWKNDPHKVHYLKSSEAIVSTTPMPTWKEFFYQRIRWASKTLYYDDYRVLGVLFFIYLFNLFFVVLFISIFWNVFFLKVAIIFLISKTLIEFPFLYQVAKFYRQKKLLPYFLFFQPLHIFYTVSIGLLSQFGKYKWKGRSTK